MINIDINNIDNKNQFTSSSIITCMSSSRRSRSRSRERTCSTATQRDFDFDDNNNVTITILVMSNSRRRRRNNNSYNMMDPIINTLIDFIRKKLRNDKYQE